MEGNGFRRIERLTGVCHNTVINCGYASPPSLPDEPDYETIPEVSQLDELQNYVAKKNQFVNPEPGKMHHQNLVEIDEGAVGTFRDFQPDQR